MRPTKRTHDPITCFIYRIPAQVLLLQKQLSQRVEMSSLLISMQGGEGMPQDSRQIQNP